MKTTRVYFPEASHVLESVAVSWDSNDARFEEGRVLPAQYCPIGKTRKEISDVETKEIEKRQAASARRKANNQAMRSLGLVKVKGNLGGTYWE